VTEGPRLSLDLDDASLVRAVAQGSEDALGLLYDRHVGGIHATVTRLTNDRQMAEEVVQDTFLALWNRAELFDAAMGSLAAWLHSIARNRAVDRLRATGRRPMLVAAGPGDGADSPESGALDRLASTHRVIGGATPIPDPAVMLEHAELELAIRSAVDEMPGPEQTVILMAYRDGLSQSEIAEHLGWPIGTVKTRTRRGLRRLRTALESDYDPAGASAGAPGADVESDLGLARGPRSFEPEPERFGGILEIRRSGVTDAMTSDRGHDGPR
jgi:RNA polymerase sigma-70 factor (ECF subfamily)